MKDQTVAYPWLEPAWTTLSAHRESGRIPQALLIHGAAGLGKTGLAVRFAQSLLCAAGGDAACGQCHSCHLFAADTHPDYQYLAPEEPGKAIKVDAIRKLINDLALKPQYGGYRVFIIDQADQMNLSSANALLKTLEEPAEKTLLFLITERPSRLPPTILSRCQKLMIRGPRIEEAIRWLQAQQPGDDAEVLLSTSGGSPLRALALVGRDSVKRRQQVFAEFIGVLRHRQDPVIVADRWQTEPLPQCIEWVMSWVVDLARLTIANPTAHLRNSDLGSTLRDVAQGVEPRSLLAYWDYLLKCRRALDGQANRQLLLEEVLIRASYLRHAPTAGSRAA
jgi:DNA polymerase-3 subunit delta'